MEDLNNIDINNYNVIERKNIGQADIKIIGDIKTISQVVQLLSYIRHIIQNNMQSNINVKIGNNVVNTQFAFDVNNQEIKDYVNKDFIEIN